MQMTPNCTKSLPVIVIVRLYNTPYPILISGLWKTTSASTSLIKCKVLTITRKKNPIIHDYTLGSQNLTRVDSEKDLGITTTSKLSWDIHANTIVAKANKILGVLRRTCTKLMDMKATRTLYLSLVKPSCVILQRYGRRLTASRFQDVLKKCKEERLGG
jgi:hypothetical protein